MKTEELIKALSRDVAPVAPRTVERRLALTSLAGLAPALALVVLVYQARPDLLASPTPSLLKALFVALALAAAAPLALAAARPATRLRGSAMTLAAFFVVSAVAAVVATLLAPSGARAHALFQGGLPPCLFEIPIAAAPVALLLGLAARSLGPTRLAHAGAAIGALAGGVGALAYVLHCQMDSAAYVFAWYAAAIAFCAGLGALLGPRLLRW